MTTFPPQHITIAQSGTVSDMFSVRNAKLIGLWAPTVDQCSAFILAAFARTSPNSADFTRVAKVDGSAAFSWNLGTGSASIVLPEQFAGIPFGKVELGVPQSDVRTIVLFGVA